MSIIENKAGSFGPKMGPGIDPFSPELTTARISRFRSKGRPDEGIGGGWVGMGGW